MVPVERRNVGSGEGSEVSMAPLAREELEAVARVRMSAKLVHWLVRELVQQLVHGLVHEMVHGLGQRLVHQQRR